MEATEKIINIMTRWQRCNFVHGDQITSEDAWGVGLLPEFM